MVKTLFVKNLYTDKQIKEMEGKWITEDDIKFPIIKDDTDVYYKYIDKSNNIESYEKVFCCIYNIILYFQLISAKGAKECK